MMKIFFLILFMIPMCFIEEMFWMIQMIIFFSILMFMILNINMMFFFNLSYLLGCDMISYGLILLSMWICVLMILSSEYIYKNNYYYQYFIFTVIFLLLMLYLTFSSMNLFMFYLFFEGSLIPTLILIIGWGYQPERIQAIMYLLFYTLFASLPMLLGIFFLKMKMESLMMYFMKFYDFNFIILYISMIFAFLIKMPMFFVHLWLPKAHVEAPVSGSMILAGIMLKLGGYGLLRIMVIFQKIGLNYNFILISVSLIGGFIISLICMCQIDIKCLIAYSSVVHMSMVLGGILTMNYWGIYGSYILMIGHGLCSSGMFYLININYERFFSRSLYINKGLLNYLPSMSMWWFMLLISNMAAPPSLNLLGEISLLNSLISWSYLTMFMLMMISFFSAAYSLYLYSYSQHGLMYMGMYNFYNGVSREFLVLMLHWFPLNFFFLKLELLMF